MAFALLALTIDERVIILAALEDPPEGLAELRAVLLNEHEWHARTRLTFRPIPPVGIKVLTRRLVRRSGGHFRGSGAGMGASAARSILTPDEDKPRLSMRGPAPRAGRVAGPLAA